MNLEKLCQIQLVESINNLPSSLKEEVVSKSIKKIEEDVYNKILSELKSELPLKISMLTRKIIDDYNDGKIYKGIYTSKLDSLCHEIAYNLVQDNYSQLVHNNNNNIQEYRYSSEKLGSQEFGAYPPHGYVYSDIEYDSDEYYDSYN